MLLYASPAGCASAARCVRDEEATRPAPADRAARRSRPPSTRWSRAAELFVASFLPPGTATVLHYAHRLVHAIGGTVLFRSIMVAVLPRLTRAFVAEGPRRPRVSLGNLGLHLMVSVSFPLTALGVVLAVPAAEAVFGIGRFSHHDARMLGLVIAVLSVSFPRRPCSGRCCCRTTRSGTPRCRCATASAARWPTSSCCRCACCRLTRHRVRPARGGGGLRRHNVVNVVHARWRLRDSGLPVPRVERRVLARSIAASLAGGAVAALVWAEAPEGLPGGQPARLAAAGLLALLAVIALERPRRALGPRTVDTAVPARRREPGTAERFSRILAVGLCAGVAVGLTTLGFLREWGSIAMVAPIGLFVGIGLVALAIMRFEMFLLALLVTRTSLDAVGSGSAVEPAAMLGILFLGAGGAGGAARRPTRSRRRRRADRARPASSTPQGTSGCRSPARGRSPRCCATRRRGSTCSPAATRSVQHDPAAQAARSTGCGRRCASGRRRGTAAAPRRRSSQAPPRPSSRARAAAAA